MPIEFSAEEPDYGWKALADCPKNVPLDQQDSVRLWLISGIYVYAFSEDRPIYRAKVAEFGPQPIFRESSRTISIRPLKTEE